MTAPIKLPPDPTEIISRAEAKARGLKRYFTWEPCFHGHSSERWTKSGACVFCAELRHERWRAIPANAEKRNSRTKKYTAENPVKVKLSVRECSRSYMRRARIAQIALQELGVVCEYPTRARRALKELGIEI